MAFEQVFGPITVQERVDYAASLTAWAALAAMGWKGTPAEVKMEWETADKPAQDPAAMIKFMRGLQKRKRKKRGRQ